MVKNNRNEKSNVIPIDPFDWTMEQILRSNGKTEEEIQDYLKVEQSDDLLFKAYEAQTSKEAIALAKKALKIYPDNIDAQNLITIEEEDPIKKLKRFVETLEKAESKLTKEDFFIKDNIGSFWGIIETRPYMRTRHNYILTLIELGRYSEAIVECEEMLRLCQNDNLGIRYIVIGLYIILERYQDAEKLYSIYREGSTQMLYPLAIMYYKQGKYTKCKKVIEQIEEVNIYLYEMLIKNRELDLSDCDELYAKRRMYTNGSMEEAYMVMNNNMYLIMSVPSYWIYLDNEFNV